MSPLRLTLRPTRLDCLGSRSPANGTEPRLRSGHQTGQEGGLMIDEREKVTYPDGVQSPDGTIYIIYDHQRTPLGEVLMATFTEEDIRAGEPVSGKVRLRVPVARLPVESDD